MPAEDREASGGVPAGETRQVTEMLGSIVDHPHRFDGEVIMPLLVGENAYYRGEAERVTLSVIEQAPDRVIRDIDRLTALLEGDPDHIGELVTVLAEVIDVGDQHLSAHTVDMLASRLERSEDDDERRRICLLIGNGVTDRGADALLRTAELDVRLAETAISELEQMVDRAVADLGGSRQRWEGTEAVLLRVAQQRPETLDPHLDVLFDALGMPRCDIVSVLGRYFQQSAPPAVDVPAVAWEILNTADGGGEHQRASDALELVIDVGALSEGLPKLIERYSGTLETSDVDAELRHALDQLTTLAHVEAEPVAELLPIVGQVARGAPDGGLRRPVRRLALACLDDGERPVIDVLSGMVGQLGGRSAVETLGSHLGILRVWVEGSKVPVEPDPAGIEILSRLREHLSNSADTEIILPIHRPRLLASVVLEAAFYPNIGSQLVLLDVGGGEWGAKKHVRDLLGLCEVIRGQDADRSVVVTDAVDERHVRNDGQLSTSTLQADHEITFIRKLSELGHVDTGQFDHVLLFHVDRVDDGVAKQTNDLFGESDIPVTGIYSMLTRHISGDLPRYGPPDVSDPTVVTPNRPQIQALEGTVEDSRRYHPNHIAQFGPIRFDVDRKVTLRGVDSGEQREHFDSAYDKATELQRIGNRRVANKLFSSISVFERLPIPADTFDAIRREIRKEGGKYLAWPTTEYVERVHRLQESEERRIILDLVDAHGHLVNLRDSAAEISPMYEELQSSIIESVQRGERVMLLLNRKSWKPIVERALEADIGEDLAMSDGDLLICGPREARSARKVDEVLVPGPLPPWLMGLHHHVRTSHVTVLMYDLRWEATTRRHLRGHVEDVRSIMGMMASDSFLNVSVDVDRAGLSEVVELPSEDSDVRTRGDEHEVSDLERLFANSRKFRESRNTRTGMSDRYKITSARDARQIIFSGLVLILDGSDGYEWVPVDVISRGDQLVVFDRELRERLWEEHLEDYHGGQDGSVLDFIEYWHEAVESLIDESATEWTIEHGSNDHLNRLALEIKKAGCEKTKSTIKTWLKSIHDTDGARELVWDPSHVIGPRSVGDLKLILSMSSIGEGPRPDDVARAMKTIRTAHRKQGVEFRARRQSYVEKDPDPRSLEGVDVVTVERISKLDGDYGATDE